MRTAYDPASPSSILRFGKRMEGRTLSEICPGRLDSGRAHTAHSKGDVGDCIEQHFGIRKNNKDAPDFPLAGVELKTLPLVRGVRDDKWHIKERTKVCNLNFHTIIGEAWATASVRKKLNHILFVFYGYDRELPICQNRVIKVMLWEPTADDLRQFKSDWEHIRVQVLRGLAHEIHEGDTQYLGACTSGPGGERSMVSQPNSRTPAPQRAFSLRPPFTRMLLESRSWSASLGLAVTATSSDMEAVLLERLGSASKTSIGELGRRYPDLNPANKSFCSAVIRRLLGAPEGRTRVEEADLAGVLIRVVPVDSEGRPFEHISLPPFSHEELVGEEWKTSVLRTQLKRMLIVPLVGAGRGMGQNVHRRIGRSFFWTPDKKEDAIIRSEWEMFRNRILAGKADELPSATQTRIIHVRPHGKDSRDRDAVPGGGTVTKKSFWLNKVHVQELLRHVA